MANSVPGISIPDGIVTVSDTNPVAMFDSACVTETGDGVITRLTVTLPSSWWDLISSSVSPGLTVLVNHERIIISGDASTADYQSTLRNLVFRRMDNSFPPSGSVNDEFFRVSMTDSNGNTATASRHVATRSLIDPTVADFSSTNVDQAMMLAEGSPVTKVIGGNGNNILIGNHGNNTITCGSRSNQIYGNGGNDTIIGNANGSSTFWVDGLGNVQIVQNSSHDALNLYGTQPTAGWTAGQAGNSLVLGINGGTTGATGQVVLQDWYNKNAADRLQGFVFADHMVAGWNNGAGVSINLADACYGQNNIQQAQVFDSGRAIVKGNDAANTLDGGANADIICGYGGNDVLHGYGGNDTVDGGIGNDYLSGESGDDYLLGGEGNDSMDGGEGNDTLMGGADKDVLWGAAGDDILVGGFGPDEYCFGRGDGHDLVLSDSGSNEDTVMLYNISNFNDTSLSFNDNDLVITIQATGATLTLRDWGLGGGYRLNDFMIASMNGLIRGHISNDGKSWLPG